MELDVNKILEILPHKPPFVFVDRIISIEEDKKIIGIKNVTIDEWFFQGHFPGYPIMPGVLILEGIGQTGALLLYKKIPNPQNKLIYFAGVDKVKFRKPVFPGDQIRYEVEVVTFNIGAKRSFCEIKGMAYVGDQLTTEAVLRAVVMDKQEPQ